MAKLDGMAHMTPHLRRVADAGLNVPLLVHKKYHVVNKEGALVDSGCGGNQSGHTGGDGSQGAGVEGIVADFALAADNAVGDKEKQAAVHRCGHKGCQDAPNALLHNQPPDAAKIAGEDFFIIENKHIGQVKEPQLLDRVLVHEHVRIIGHLAPILGMEEHVLKVLFAIGEGDNGAGQGEQNHNQRRKPGHSGQDEDETHHRNQGADNGEGVGDHLD